MTLWVQIDALLLAVETSGNNKLVKCCSQGLVEIFNLDLPSPSLSSMVTTISSSAVANKNNVKCNETIIWKLKVRVFKDNDFSFLQKVIPSSVMTDEVEPELLA